MIHVEAWYQEAFGEVQLQELLELYDHAQSGDEQEQLLVPIWQAALRLGVLPDIPSHELWNSARLLPKELGDLKVKMRPNRGDFRGHWVETPLPEVVEAISDWAMTEGGEPRWGPTNFDFLPGQKESPQTLRGEAVQWLEIDAPQQWREQIRKWTRQQDPMRFDW